MHGETMKSENTFLTNVPKHPKAYHTV